MWGWAHVLAIQPNRVLYIRDASSLLRVWVEGGGLLSSSKAGDWWRCSSFSLSFFNLGTPTAATPCVFSARLLSIQRHFSLGAQSSVTRFPYEPSQAKPGQERLSGSPSTTNTQPRRADDDDDSGHSRVSSGSLFRFSSHARALVCCCCCFVGFVTTAPSPPPRAHNTSITQTPSTQASSSSASASMAQPQPQPVNSDSTRKNPKCYTHSHTYGPGQKIPYFSLGRKSTFRRWKLA